MKALIVLAVMYLIPHYMKPTWAKGSRTWKWVPCDPYGRSL